MITPPSVLADPEQMGYHDICRAKAAAHRATKLYPGAVGELISRELVAFADFGFRVQQDAVVPRVVDQIMKPQA